MELTSKKIALFIPLLCMIALSAISGCLDLQRYSVGGTLSGLNGTLLLQNDETNDLEITTDGNFIFTDPVSDGSFYSVTALRHPENQTCTVSNGSGNIHHHNITNVVVTCSGNTSTYTVGGTVSGLNGSVTLLNSDGQQVQLTSDGSFHFANPLANQSPYDVTVLTQPDTQTCVITSGSGTVSGQDVASVAVNCTTNTYTIGGTLSGLALGDTVVLQNNGGDNLSLTSDGAFTFSASINDGTNYSVTVLTNPSSPTSQTCTIDSGTGSGSVLGSNVGSVGITCVTDSAEDASFTYTSATYCQSGSDQTPTITGSAGGTFSSIPAGLSINPSTGTINLSSSALGTYILSYTTNGIVPAVSSITMTITNVAPLASFSYSLSSFCQNGSNPSPIFGIGASAGLFSAPVGLDFMHVNTGEINLTASTPNTPDTYVVTNTIPASGSCSEVIETTTVTITPTDDASFTYPSTTYSQTGNNPTPTITGAAGGTFSSIPAGLSMNPSTGTIILSSSALGTYTLSYTTNGTCPAENSITMTIDNAAPTASFTANPTSGAAPLTVNFTNNSTNAVNHLWDFGNGDTSLVENPSYIYTLSGSFTVCLTADDGAGAVDTACSIIDVSI